MSRIDELLQQMTIEEKISMLAGADLWHSVAVARVGIPQFRVTDGPNGARGSWGGMGPSSVATPVGIALGATWNPGLVEKVGNVLGDELKAKGAHILLALIFPLPFKDLEQGMIVLAGVCPIDAVVRGHDCPRVRIADRDAEWLQVDLAQRPFIHF